MWFRRNIFETHSNHRLTIVLMLIPMGMHLNNLLVVGPAIFSCAHTDWTVFVSVKSVGAGFNYTFEKFSRRFLEAEENYEIKLSKHMAGI